MKILPTAKEIRSAIREAILAVTMAVLFGSAALIYRDMIVNGGFLCLP